MTCTDWFERPADRTGRIDSMLNFMVCEAACENKESGRVPSYTLEEIADFVGCDVMVIARAEIKALRSVRSKNPELKLHLARD